MYVECASLQVNDPYYSNCNQDCAYNSIGDVVTITGVPRLGPIGDSGAGRVVVGSTPTYRLWAGATPELGLLEGDLIYAAKNCSTGAPAADGEQHTAVMSTSHSRPQFNSVFIRLPPSLTTNGFSIMRLCFATKELGPEPSIADWTVLPDSLVIVLPPLFTELGYARSITRTAPDLAMRGADGTGGWGISAGDKVYFRESCAGPADPPQEFASKLLDTIGWNDPVLGPTCDYQSATWAPTVWHSEILQRSTCGSGSSDADPTSDPGATLGVLSPDAELWCPIQADAGNVAINYEVAAEWMNSNAAGSWLQLDAGSPIVVAALVTSGWQDAWVQYFALSFSQDGIQWTEYRGPDGVLMLMRANADAGSDVVVALSGVPLQAR